MKSKMESLEAQIQTMIRESKKRWARSICNVNEKGEILINEKRSSPFLNVFSFHKLRTLDNRLLYIHIKNGSVEEIDTEYVKNYLVGFLLINGPEEIKKHLNVNNIHFSSRHLEGLRERVPYDVSEDNEEYLLKEGTLIVNKDEIHLYRQDY